MLILVLFSCSSCRKQGRPNAELCTKMADSSWECEDAYGKVRILREEEEGTLLATTPSGYASLERYVDGLELKIKELQVNCRR